MAKHVAKKWSEISLTKERDHWEEEARKDKLRYYHEKQAYKGPWRILNKRAKKDPGAPKRPMSAFLHFAQTERAKLKLKDPNLSFSEISKSLAETWKNLSEELRKPHLEWELKERATYNKKVAEFKAKKEQEKSRKEQRAKEAALRQEMEATKNNYIESSTIVPVTPFSHGGHTSSISAQPQDSNQVSLKELSYDEGNSSFSRRFRGCRRAKAYPQVKNENSLHNSNDLLGPIAVKPEPQSKLCITSQTKSSNVAKFEIGTVGQHHINFESRYNDGTHSPVPHIKKPSLLPSCTPIVVSRFPAYVPQANNIPTQKLSRDIFPWNPSPSCHRLNFDDSLPFPLNKNFDEYNMHIEESRISHATDADNLNPVDNDRGRNPNGRDSNNHSHIPVPQDIPSENPCFENVNNMEHGNNDDNDVNMNHYDEESPGTPELLDESGYMSDTNNSYVSRDIFSSIANNMNFSIGEYRVQYSTALKPFRFHYLQYFFRNRGTHCSLFLFLFSVYFLSQILLSWVRLNPLM